MPRALKGFTLVELLIGLVVGLTVMASLGSLLVNLLRHQAETERQLQLIEETAALSQFVYTELRRAGYSGAGSASAPYDRIVIQGGSCVLFGYDANHASAPYFGFRKKNDTIEWLAASQATQWQCNASGGWVGLHDASAVEVSTFTLSAWSASAVRFDLSTRQAPGGSDAVAASLSETRYVTPRNGIPIEVLP